jgi:hypothetical protein
MFGIAYSPASEAVQCRKSARSYLAAYRGALDSGLRASYRAMFISELRLARALERSA